jgi:chromosome segregation ATPase
VRWIVRVAFVVVVGVVGMRVRNRQMELAAAGEEIDVGRQGVEHAEAYVDDLDARIDDAVARMRELDARLSAIEAQHPRGIPAAEREEYDRLLTRRNEIAAEHNDLVGRRRSAVRDYEDDVARHNARVDGANALAEESTPWRIVIGLWERVGGHPARE